MVTTQSPCNYTEPIWPIFVMGIDPSKTASKYKVFEYVSDYSMHRYKFLDDTESRFDYKIQ